jgi:hypothetical protein
MRRWLALAVLQVGSPGLPAALAAVAVPDVRATVLSITDGDTTRGMEGGKPITVCLACNRCAAA